MLRIKVTPASGSLFVITNDFLLIAHLSKWPSDLKINGTQPGQLLWLVIEFYFGTWL